MCNASVYRMVICGGCVPSSPFCVTASYWLAQRMECAAAYLLNRLFSDHRGCTALCLTPLSTVS